MIDLSKKCTIEKCWICAKSCLYYPANDKRGFILAKPTLIEWRLNNSPLSSSASDKALMLDILKRYSTGEIVESGEQKEKENMENKEKTYEQGLEEAWEIARKIIGDTKHQDEYSSIDLDRIFGTDRRSRDHLLDDFPSIHEVKEKIEAYEAEQAKPKLGDVVKISDIGEFLFLGEGREHYYVLDPSDNDGIPHQFVIKNTANSIKKTGKHFDIQSMLDEIKD